VDLGGSTSITRVVLRWEAAYGSAYQIQVSNDDASWTSIFTTTTGDGGVDDLTVSGSGRYVRMYGTARGTAYGYSLWEMEVMGTVGATPTATARPTATATATVPPTATSTSTATATATTRPRATATSTARPRATATATTRPRATSTARPRATATATTAPRATATATTPATSLLSQGRPVVASSAENAGTAAANAVDGSTTTRWSSAFSDPQWIYVDLGSARQVSRVVLNWEAAYGSAYQLQSSNDAVNWSAFYTTTTGNGALDDLTVAANGRYIRMYGTARATQWGYSLWEFQVYGQ
jgi:hypothetical protein